MANSSLNLVSLDFDTIKENLKSFLKTNTQFKDMNFDGSNINVLLDVLSYNTYLNNFYLNMIASEMFMDSAQIRSNILSHARELNYIPRSFRSSQALINVKVTPANSSVSSLLIPKGTTFTAKIGSNTFTFSTQETISSFTTTGQFNVDVPVYEGIYVQETFMYELDNETEEVKQKMILTNPQIDVRSLTVSVLEDGGSTVLSYDYKTSIEGVSGTTNAFFLQTTENDQYEIIFGDGVVGRRPKQGAVIVAEYRVCNGELPNGASVFSNDGSIDGHTNVVVTVVDVASGGVIHESIESIRFNAPRYFQTGQRAITAEDYKVILQTEFADIDAINVYGGEEMDPPQFGKVFISVNQDNSDGVTTERKRIYADYIKTRAALGIEPEFIDPDFLYVKCAINVYYNINITEKNTTDIATAVAGAVSNFNDQYIDNFDCILRYSKLIKTIDDSDASILSNDTKLIVYRLLVPDTDSIFSTTQYFNNPIQGSLTLGIEETEEEELHAVYSDIFTSEGRSVYFEDDGKGFIHLVAVVGAMRSVAADNVGTVDYESGIVTINNIQIDSFSGNGIKLYGTLKNKDIVALKNTILTIRDADINIQVFGERE